MNTHRYFASSVLASLALGMVFVAGPLFAQSHPVKPASHVNTTQQTQQKRQQTFAGTIAKSGSSYVLKAAGKTYRLDGQVDVAKYVGKQVKVTGVFNAMTDTIQVLKIKPASAM